MVKKLSHNSLIYDKNKGSLIWFDDAKYEGIGFFVESSKDVHFDVVFETDGIKIELDITLLLFSPFCAMVLGKDYSILEQMICIRLVPINNSPATENIAEDFIDSSTEECLLFDDEYMHRTISLFIIPVNEL
ncbi:11962_t:CDS:2 [Funneliformis geosporum]|uniref:16921_t:CDS:1 n=1 Tax=Funneliformis geosporum TaxID=1117311 RepID=A0A9W4X070_9GLOM|nr:16921_t:CDS:2 [Funneliformis geosporum]CAI2185661.1 11962_t:CDS:2 [Funneliformis geosporum]